MNLRTAGVFLTCILAVALLAHAGGGRILSKVISVNEKTVSLNKGAHDGVEPGMLFDIYREAKVIFVPMTKEKVFVEEKIVAQAIVTKLSPGTSTCEIVKLAAGEQVTVGDTAVNVKPEIAPKVNAPPVIEAIKASHEHAYASEEVVITATVSDVNDTFHIYHWSCDAGQLSARETVVGEVRWLCPAEAAEATVTLEVTDLNGARALMRKKIKALGPGARGKKFQPVASFGETTPRFRKIACIEFDQENHLLVLDPAEKRIITLSDDFNIERVSALYGEESSFCHVAIHGSCLYAVDSKSGSLNRYKYEGDIFRRKPDVIYGARGSGNGYFGSIAGVEVNDAGDVYVLDKSHCVVHIFTANGNFLCSIGRRGNRPGEMKLPTAIAMDAQYNYYISDYSRRKILKFDSQNRFLAEYNLDGKIGSPMSIRYNRRSNNLMILDYERRTVYVMSTAGKLVRQFKKPANPLASLVEPEQLAVSRTGEVFVVCEKGEVLRRYSEGGKFLGKLGGEDLSGITAFTATPEGGLYLLDADKFTVWHLDHNGWITSRFGGYGPTPSQFQAPVAICSDSAGNAYVLDRAFNSIRKFSREGKFLKAIGKPGSGKDNINSPVDLFSSGDRIYLLQYRNRWAVHVYNPDGKFLALYPDKESETSRPAQIAVDNRGNSFIFSKSYEVQFFNREGAKRPGVRKTSIWLADLATDPRGDLFGVDSRRGELFRIDPNRQGAQWTFSPTRAAQQCVAISFDNYGRMYLLDQATKAIVRLREVVR